MTKDHLAIPDFANNGMIQSVPSDPLLRSLTILEIFFSFSKRPSQVKFQSSVQIFWKLLVCIEGVDSLQTNNFHKI